MKKFITWLLTKPEETDLFFVHIREAVQSIHGMFWRKDDPVKMCEVYRTSGCSHVDGIECDMNTCKILKEHRRKIDEAGC